MENIKFRVWDKKNKIMLIQYKHENGVLKFHKEGWEGIPFTYPFNERVGDFEVMQYTGLKDSKGTEIYTGDILSDKGIIAGVVTFGKYKRAKYFKRGNPVNHLGWYVKDGISVESLEHIFYNLVENCKITNDNNYIEIIGNIYEDSNLLNK